MPSRIFTIELKPKLLKIKLFCLKLLLLTPLTIASFLLRTVTQKRTSKRKKMNPYWTIRGFFNWNLKEEMMRCQLPPWLNLIPWTTIPWQKKVWHPSKGPFYLSVLALFLYFSPNSTFLDYCFSSMSQFRINRHCSYYFSLGLSNSKIRVIVIKQWSKLMRRCVAPRNYIF